MIDEQLLDNPCVFPSLPSVLLSLQIQLSIKPRGVGGWVLARPGFPSVLRNPAGVRHPLV